MAVKRDPLEEGGTADITIFSKLIYPFFKLHAFNSVQHFYEPGRAKIDTLACQLMIADRSNPCEKEFNNKLVGISGVSCKKMKNCNLSLFSIFVDFRRFSSSFVVLSRFLSNFVVFLVIF